MILWRHGGTTFADIHYDDVYGILNDNNTISIGRIKDTNQWLPGSISSYRHHSDPMQSGNG